MCIRLVPKQFALQGSFGRFYIGMNCQAVTEMVKYLKMQKYQRWDQRGTQLQQGNTIGCQ